jgi:hypothetical protein
MVITLLDAVAAYKTIAAAEGKSPKTVESVSASAGCLDAFLGGAAPLAELTPEDLRRWIAALRQRARYACLLEGDSPSLW